MNHPHEQSIDAMVAFGQVVTVRPVPTRAVTQIVIEIPDNYHVAATTMLFGRNAFIFAANPNSSGKFGVGPLSEMQEPEPKRSAQPTEEHGHRIGGGLSTNIHPAKWLGIQCGDVQFQDWIGADSTESAADRAREICQVTSRGDIQGRESAMRLFMTRIYRPYTAYKEENLQATQMARQV